MSKCQNDPKEIRWIKNEGHPAHEGKTKGRNAKKQSIKNNDV